MSKSLELKATNLPGQNHQSKVQLFLMSGSLIGINLGLMIYVGMYWLHPSFHAFLAGKTL